MKEINNIKLNLDKRMVKTTDFSEFKKHSIVTFRNEEGWKPIGEVTKIDVNKGEWVLCDIKIFDDIDISNGCYLEPYYIDKDNRERMLITVSLIQK